jgi:hypothetical protein
MAHLDQFITVYDSAPNMGITCPSSYADEAQEYFRQHDLFLVKPSEESQPPAEALITGDVVWLPMAASSDDAEQELQKLHNLAGKFREYIRREADRGAITE